MTTISAALLLFLILDPLGNIPVFLSLLKPLPIGRIGCELTPRSGQRGSSGR